MYVYCICIGRNEIVYGLLRTSDNVVDEYENKVRKYV